MPAQVQSPAVSVVIPTKNRKQILLETIDSVLKQSVAVEVIVVDDGSTDGTTELLHRTYPPGETPVQVIRRDISGGPTVCRNLAAERATTPYLFTIDDDCVVSSPLTFEQTLRGFDHPRIAAVTIPFINVHQGPEIRYRAPAEDDIYVSLLFYGGMVAFRRSIFLAMGGYRTAYIIYVEEPDLVLRLLDAGYVVRLGSADPIQHMESPIRNRTRNLMLMSRNHVLLHWFNAPMPDLLIRVPVAATGSMLDAIKNRRPDLGLLGLARGLGRVWNERKNRRPLRPAIHALYRQIRFKTPRLSEIEPVLSPLPNEAGAVSQSDG